MSPYERFVKDFALEGARSFVSPRALPWHTLRMLPLALIGDRWSARFRCFAANGATTMTTGSDLSAPLESLVGSGTIFRGDVEFSGVLRVEGKVVGGVCGAGPGVTRLWIEGDASVEGDVRVDQAYIDGLVLGSVRSLGFLELGPNARILGNVYYSHLEIQLGATVGGQLVHEESAAANVVSLKQVSAVFGTSDAGDHNP